MNWLRHVRYKIWNKSWSNPHWCHHLCCTKTCKNEMSTGDEQHNTKGRPQIRPTVNRMAVVINDLQWKRMAATIIVLQWKRMAATINVLPEYNYLTSSSLELMRLRKRRQSQKKSLMQLAKQISLPMTFMAKKISKLLKPMWISSSSESDNYNPKCLKKLVNNSWFSLKVYLSKF